jgi:hypothetical protein
MRYPDPLCFGPKIHSSFSQTVPVTSKTSTITFRHLCLTEAKLRESISIKIKNSNCFYNPFIANFHEIEGLFWLDSMVADKSLQEFCLAAEYENGLKACKNNVVAFGRVEYPTTLAAA